MSKRPLLEFILQVINFILTLCSLGTLGYGLVCFFNYKQNPSKEIPESNVKYMVVHRLLLAIGSSKSSSDQLPKAWFIYLLIGIGAILFIISCFGYVGTASRSPCCLLFYCVLLVALITIEIGVAAFIVFKHNWEEVIPTDGSGTFQSVYHFLHQNWEVNRWIALGVFILQVIAMIVALYLIIVFNRGWYDRSDDDDEPVVYLPRARTNYSQPVQTNRTPSTTTTVSGRGPTKLDVKTK